jgi:hypothetical protein
VKEYTGGGLLSDEVQTDPLRQLANHWRTMASAGTSEGFAAAGVAYELADQLTAILNSVARKTDL